MRFPILFYRYFDEYNIELNALDYFEIFLWILSMVVFIIVGLTFYKDSKKRNKMYINLALFFSFFAISRVFRLISKFVIGYQYGTTQFTGTLLILAILFNIVSYIGLFAYYLYLEKRVVKKTHYFLSICIIIVIIISIISYFVYVFIYLLIPFYLIVILSIPIIYTILAIRSEGKVRVSAIIIMIGMMLIIIGNALDAPGFAPFLARLPILTVIAQIAAPSLMIVGCLLIRKGFPREL